LFSLPLTGTVNLQLWEVISKSKEVIATAVSLDRPRNRKQTTPSTQQRQVTGLEV